MLIRTVEVYDWYMQKRAARNWATEVGEVPSAEWRAELVREAGTLLACRMMEADEWQVQLDRVKNILCERFSFRTLLARAAGGSDADSTSVGSSERVAKGLELVLKALPLRIEDLGDDRSKVSFRHKTIGEYLWSPAHMAARFGNDACVVKHIEMKADVEKVNSEGHVPLHIAARCGRVGCLAKLIDAKVEVNKVNSLGETGLSLASEHGHVECVRALIAANADLNQRDSEDVSPVMKAFTNGHHECLRELSEADDIGNVDDKGKTLVYRAVERRDLACVGVLIEVGADVNRADEDGITPVSVACGNGPLPNGHVKCLHALMVANANVNLADKYMKTPQIVAWNKGNVECLHALFFGALPDKVVNAGSLLARRMVCENKWELQLGEARQHLEEKMSLSSAEEVTLLLKTLPLRIDWGNTESAVSFKDPTIAAYLFAKRLWEMEEGWEEDLAVRYFTQETPRVAEWFRLLVRQDYRRFGATVRPLLCAIVEKSRREAPEMAKVAGSNALGLLARVVSGISKVSWGGLVIRNADLRGLVLSRAHLQAALFEDCWMECLELHNCGTTECEFKNCSTDEDVKQLGGRSRGPSTKHGKTESIGKQYLQTEGHEDEINGMALSADGKIPMVSECRVCSWVILNQRIGSRE